LTFVELALRGQEYPTQDLLDYRYREKFHLTQKELEEEPHDIYLFNTSIMLLENKIYDEQQRREQRRMG
jgi:hypothetical protein